jgi:diguanylate cyclase (GGDEF)-like protein
VFVAYLDIDSFKVVNDTLGHHVGDELVRQVAMRLRRALPSTDFLSRFGGDEFVLMRRSPGGRATADELGTQIMDLMREPFLISGNTLEVTCSCGISWGPEQSEDPGELLRRADIALYRAKQRGRARYRRFTRDMDASLKLRREMEMELRRAIARDELSVAFQPIIGLPDGGIHGFEALLRWYHPDRGEIRPGLFVPVAEQAGLMIPLGNWVLRRVFNECHAWPCDISVNLSPLQIMASDFLVTLRTILAETGMDPRRVVLEVTEGVMLDRSEHVFSVLRELNGMGFRIALDDFGIGYSSLSYLRSFQFDRIKIDRSFVQNVEGDVDAHSILCAIVSLGHTLRMKVVAEGVETDVQRQLVQAAGCELVQGHLFWAALAPQEAFALLTRDAQERRGGSSGKHPLSARFRARHQPGFGQLDHRHFPGWARRIAPIAASIRSCGASCGRWTVRITVDDTAFSSAVPAVGRAVAVGVNSSQPGELHDAAIETEIAQRIIAPHDREHGRQRRVVLQRLAIAREQARQDRLRHGAVDAQGAGRAEIVLAGHRPPIGVMAGAGQ